LFIDKITAICCLKNIEPVIVINKTDLDSTDNIFDIYKSAGFVVLKISTLKDDVKQIISPFIKDKVCAFVGLSGVGKSSIINSLNLSVKMEVGDISRKKLMRGKHTTRSCRAYRNQGRYVC
jgi:ribosome biogenesis GTPase